MHRRTFLKTAALAAAMVSAGSAAAKTFNTLRLPTAATWIEDRTALTYVILGDGFEFLIPRNVKNLQAAILYAAQGMYCFQTKEWIKFQSDVYDFETEKYLTVPSRVKRTDFSAVPVMNYAELADIGYMRETDSEFVRYRFNDHFYRSRANKAMKDTLASLKGNSK